MKLNPAPDSFGYDKLEFVTREPLRTEFMASVGCVPPSGDWLDKMYRYMVTTDLPTAKGALEAFWMPRKWVRDTLPFRAIFNPSRANYSGWATWDYLTNSAFSWLSNAKIRRIDTKLDFTNTLAEVLSCLVLKGAKRVHVDPKRPRTIYIGGMMGVQLVIYDKGLKEWGVPDVWIRVEVRQWFETDVSAHQRRPFMIEFMRGDLVGSHPFKDVVWIDPNRLDPRVSAVAEKTGINYAMLPESGLTPALRDKTRRQVWNHGTDGIHRLYLSDAEPWHQSFVYGSEMQRLTTALDTNPPHENPYAGMTMEEILFGPTTTPPAYDDRTLWEMLIGDDNKASA